MEHFQAPVLVTVTYGDRYHLLAQVLAAALDEGIDTAIVVCNGNGCEIRPQLEQQFGDWARVIELEVNGGSAIGFKAGLQVALNIQFEHILMLDDDTKLTPGSLRRLMLYWREFAKRENPKNFAVLAHRPEHQPEVRSGAKSSICKINSFFGFEVADVPSKLLSRLRKRIGKQHVKMTPRPTKLLAGPYGGLLFSRSVVLAHGLPDENFILYSDDTEYTYRLYLAGGGVWLLPDVLLEELESSWFVAAMPRTIFHSWLLGESSLRIAYALRNQSYFEANIRLHSRLVRSINRTVFLSILRVAAWKWNRLSRYHLIIRSIRDGENGKLGIISGIPL